MGGKMIWNFIKQIVELAQFLIQGKDVLPQSKAVFEALAETIVPHTDEVTEKQAADNNNGALELHTDQFQIYILNHFISLKLVLITVPFYLANITASLLNEAARQLILKGENKKPVDALAASEKGIFAALHTEDRCRSILLLEQLEVNLANLPIPFRNNPGAVLATISIITMLATSGYYSEWSGYGSSRLETPEEREMEQFPAIWRQIGYPGPSMGYHGYRGHLSDNFTE